jgi:hypothetical protein
VRRSETWYLLIHRLPTRPLYLRARIRRALGELGAVPLKKAVYALPRSPRALEHFTRIAGEIRAGSGEAFVCEASFTSARDVAALLETNRRERSADYAGISEEAAALRATTRGARDASDRTRAEIERLKARLERARSIDHSPSPDDGVARAAIADLERSLAARGAARPSGARESLVGRTWVTRRGIHVDRLACAWVVRRFIDPAARFRFSDPNDLRAGPRDLTFDVPNGRFAHEDGRCSVETLVLRAGIDDPGARRVAEIVHDIDLKDGRFGHAETSGVERLVAGIVEGHADDRERLERGLALFDDLHRSYRKPGRVTLDRKRVPTPPKHLRRPR